MHTLYCFLMSNQLKYQIMISTNEKAIVKKANQLITAKYKYGVFESKLMAVALSRIEAIGDIPKASMHASELQSLLGGGSNLYRRLKTAANNLTGNSVCLEDGQGNFKSFAMVTDADYINQVFTISFHRNLAPYILNLKGSYTSYELKNILKFKHRYSLRIYEILRKESYQIKGNTKSVDVEYGLSEFRFMIGVLDMENKKVQQARQNGATWEELEAMLPPSSGLGDWNVFRNRVLEKAKKEMAETSDISFDYKPVRMGRGGKVMRVIFTIYKNTEFPYELKEYVGYNQLSEEDLQMLYKESGEDAQRVIDAINLAMEVPHIENYVGWLRSCVKGGWTCEKIQTVEGSKEKADRINAIKTSVEEQSKDPNSPMFVRMWENMQNRPDFGDYLADLPEKERDYLDFLDYQVRVESFIDWRKEKFKA